MSKKIILALVAVLLLAAAIVPLLLIWSLNTLFQTGIEYTFATWLAAMFISSLVVGTLRKGVL